MKGLMRSDLYAELCEAEENHWWHRYKRAMAKQILEELKPSPGKDLDVGAGGGKLLSELQKKGWQSSGVDLEPKAKQQSRKRNLNIQIADATKKIPFKTGSFDAVFAVDSLEHMKSDRKALEEMKRVTKPDGVIYLSVPAYPILSSYWDKMLGHYRRYSKKNLKHLAASTGLKIERLTYYLSFLLLPAIIVRLIKKILNQNKVSDFQTMFLPWLVKPMLKLFTQAELVLLKKVNLPFGLSLICVCRKN